MMSLVTIDHWVIWDDVLILILRYCKWAPRGFLVIFLLKQYGYHQSCFDLQFTILIAQQYSEASQKGKAHVQRILWQAFGGVHVGQVYFILSLGLYVVYTCYCASDQDGSIDLLLACFVQAFQAGQGHTDTFQARYPCGTPQMTHSGSVSIVIIVG